MHLLGLKDICKDFLEGRTKQVVVRDCCSDPSEVLSRVPHTGKGARPTSLYQ